MALERGKGQLTWITLSCHHFFIDQGVQPLDFTSLTSIIEIYLWGFFVWLVWVWVLVLVFV
jgi:hypothetical protein